MFQRAHWSSAGGALPRQACSSSKAKGGGGAGQVVDSVDSLKDLEAAVAETEVDPWLVHLDVMQLADKRKPCRLFLFLLLIF